MKLYLTYWSAAATLNHCMNILYSWDRGKISENVPVASGPTNLAERGVAGVWRAAGPGIRLSDEGDSRSSPRPLARP